MKLVLTWYSEMQTIPTSVRTSGRLVENKQRSSTNCRTREGQSTPHTTRESRTILILHIVKIHALEPFVDSPGHGLTGHTSKTREQHEMFLGRDSRVQVIKLLANANETPDRVWLVDNRMAEDRHVATCRRDFATDNA
jgi:hypothetical protein